MIGALIPAEQRALRIGVLLYAVAMTGAYVLPTAVGGNADRLGALMAGPIAACVLVGGSASARRMGPPTAPFSRARRRRALIVLAPALLYWQVNAPAADFAASVSNPAVSASYYAPLLGELRALGVGFGARPARIEVVPSGDHWEARWVAPEVMIARGWERQLDQYRNALFYDESTALTAARYRAWLSEQAIAYVALPDSTLGLLGDGRGEAAPRRALRRRASRLSARDLALGPLAAVRRARRAPAGPAARRP